MTFDSAMTNAGASLGGVGTASGITKAQFSALSDEAVRIGSTTSASASEVATAMDLMARAGVGFDTILNGGAQSVVNISEATGEATAQSAESFAAISNLYADAGYSADRLADIFTTGMNNSSASLSEFQTGITRLSPVIAATGMSFEDSAAMIAYFNAQGFGAAEVGTSLMRRCR